MSLPKEIDQVLYPNLEPFDFFQFKVDPLHSLYVEQCGNPNGIPIVFLHGGPGGGISKDYRRFFNPEKFRIVLFDQRGAGQSTPHAELENNTTWDLVDDIEKIRKHLNIDQWHVFGGSWGSTLAICYGIKHPDKVLSFILRGIFLCRKNEIQWFYQDGASHLFPDYWNKYFLAPIPKEEQSNLVSAYYKRLTSSNKETRLSAARGWSQWEASTSYLEPRPSSIEDFGDEKLAAAFARIECHYFTHNIFIESDEYLLREVKSKISHLPCKIVHGRYDVVCPVENAFDLIESWPCAELSISPRSGHSAFELENTVKLLEFTNTIPLTP